MPLHGTAWLSLSRFEHQPAHSPTRLETVCGTGWAISSRKTACLLQSTRQSPCVLVPGFSYHHPRFSSPGKAPRLIRSMALSAAGRNATEINALRTRYSTTRKRPGFNPIRAYRSALPVWVHSARRFLLVAAYASQSAEYVSFCARKRVEPPGRQTPAIHHAFVQSFLASSPVGRLLALYDVAQSQSLGLVTPAGRGILDTLSQQKRSVTTQEGGWRAGRVPYRREERLNRLPG